MTPSKAALDIAETLVNHQWGVSVYQLACAIDAAAEQERKRIVTQLRSAGEDAAADWIAETIDPEPTI